MSDPLVELARLDGVPSAIQAARDAVDAVLADRGLRVVGPELRARARWASVVATTSLADDTDDTDDSGGTGDAETSAAGVGDGPDPGSQDDPGERWRAGAARLYAELPELAATIRRTPPQALARAHTLLALDLVPEDSLGRSRGGTAVAERLAGLGRLLTASTRAPVPVLAAVAHAEIVAIGPFGTGDDVIARAVERMVLVDGGVDPPAMIISEAGHLAERARYRRLLTAYVGGRAVDVRAWLLHCADALVRGAEESPAARRS